MSPRWFARVAAAGALLGTGAWIAPAGDLPPIEYSVGFDGAADRFVDVTASVPAEGRAEVELMVPVWSPGYYRVEDYATHVSQVVARATDGRPLAVTRPAPHRWSVQAGGADRFTLAYRVFCNGGTVTTNDVDGTRAILNGAPTFITLRENTRRAHIVRLSLPASWPAVMTGLAAAPEAGLHAFRAPDYETLVDSPIMAGRLGVRRFSVAGKPHDVVSAGDVDGWDEAAAARDLEAFVAEAHRFWGVLPYQRYVFLLAFRPGGGGLEHANSTLTTVSVRPQPRPGSVSDRATASGAPSRRWHRLGLLAHEYFHLFNGKRLRPVELGPFDLENPPLLRTLWIPEGLTSYYSNLLLARAGLTTPEEFLASLSALIGGLQKAPGRLLQSVEQSSLEVWNNSNSGIAPAGTTVSYYNKGQVLGLLLDARIRHVTLGRRSLDDVIRLAYARYGGERGFTDVEFQRTAEEVAGVSLDAWFESSVRSARELDYAELLAVFGLEFTTGDAPAGSWTLAVRNDATPDQQAARRAWLTGSNKDSWGRSSRSTATRRDISERSRSAEAIWSPPTPAATSWSSGQRFEFAEDTITVVSPNRGLRWRIGSVQKIKWTHGLGGDATFRIELDRDEPFQIRPGEAVAR
jgi:predicted metalloprotease with PDZ domain